MIVEAVGLMDAQYRYLILQDEQSHMDEMYSRGIDPNMADPTKCHSHPDVPPQWPAQPQVQAYVQKVPVSYLWLLIVHGFFVSLEISFWDMACCCTCRVSRVICVMCFYSGNAAAHARLQRL